jgi:hypothetical protein
LRQMEADEEERIGGRQRSTNLNSHQEYRQEERRNREHSYQEDVITHSMERAQRFRMTNTLLDGISAMSAMLGSEAGRNRYRH